jgi:hypothetical protein
MDGDEYRRMQARIKEIDRQAATLATERADIKLALHEEELRVLRISNGVKVVCPDCYGDGEVSMEGGDTNEPYLEACSRCGGKRYLWAIEWRDEPELSSRLIGEGIMQINEVR